MSRTQLSPHRLSATKKTNLGRIIIFCEGKTEKYYFDYFAEIIKKNKYSNVEVVLEPAYGNAQRVLNFANDFLTDDINNQKYSNFGKYLVFDCDAPKNIQPVVSVAKGYDFLISNYLFEKWLLMHFEDVEKKISKREIYQRLSSHLHHKYSKGHKGKTREIIQNGNIEKAIDNAKALEEKYHIDGKNIFSDIKDMNPFTSVYKLVEQFLLEIS